MSTLEARVTELEMRLAFQDDTIHALNDVVVEQARMIDRLQLNLQLLAKRQEEFQATTGIVETETPPPHY